MERVACAAGLVLAAFAAAAAAGCGRSEEGDGAGGASGGDGEVIVSAAASLEPAFTAYAAAAGLDAKQSFAGSDDLAAQIRAGVAPDVYAAANTSLPEELHAEGLVAKPRVFATNELVIAVPRDAELGIDSVADLARPGLRLAIGDEGVPVGDYTREVLAELPANEADAILANVRSNEPDVAGIVGKLTQGAVDAGFVYATDVTASGGALERVDLPADIEPVVAYGVALVEGAENPRAGQAFIDGLLGGPGADALADAGFGPPPP